MDVDATMATVASTCGLYALDVHDWNVPLASSP